MSSSLPDRSPFPTVRLNKVLAQAGICSRRAADVLILDGRVQVNGEVVRTPGILVDPARDVVSVMGKPLPRADPGAQGHLYLALHKPAGVVTTARDPQGRTTVLDLLPEDLRRRRPFPVGRLDRMSEGLILLTTDGELALRMTHPRFEHPKTYHVRLRGRVSPEKLEAMRSGMRLAEGDQLAPVQVRKLHSQDGATTLEMTLRQGVNRQIRRMCRDLHLHVLDLVRLAQGPLRLGDLAPGAWRRLQPEELRTLKQDLAMQEDSA